MGQAFVEEVETQQQELPIAEQTEDVIREGQNMRRSKISGLCVFFFFPVIKYVRFTWYNGITISLFASLTKPLLNRLIP